MSVQGAKLSLEPANMKVKRSWAQRTMKTKAGSVWCGWSSGNLWKGRVLRIKSDNLLKYTCKLHMPANYTGKVLHFYCLRKVRKNRQIGIRVWQVLNAIHYSSTRHLMCIYLPYCVSGTVLEAGGKKWNPTSLLSRKCTKEYRL